MNSIYSFISKSLLILSFLLVAAGLVCSADPLVEPDWLMTNLNKPDIRVLDLQPSNGYQRPHLPLDVLYKRQ